MVVDNLEVAKRTAYNTHKGVKVVTIDGKMIDEFGLISVKQRPIKGLVKTVDQRLANDNQDQRSEFEKQILDLQLQIEAHNIDFRNIQTELYKCNQELY